MTPVSTSPLPPLARPESPVVFTSTLPAGAAVTVRWPFSTSTQPWATAKSRAAPTRSPRLRSPPMRANSPSWGVSTVIRPRRASRTSICPDRAFMPSASSTTGCLSVCSSSQHQPGRTLAPAQAGAQGQHVAAGQLLQDLRQGLGGEHPAFFRQRKGHGGSTLSRLHRPDGLRHPQGHQPAAGAHRRRRGEVRAHRYSPRRRPRSAPCRRCPCGRPSSGAAGPSAQSPRSTVCTGQTRLPARSAGMPMFQTVTSPL